LGWKLLLQIHDEVILEGPKETMPDVHEALITHSQPHHSLLRSQAMVEVRQCMENPFDNFGLFPLQGKIVRRFFFFI